MRGAPGFRVIIEDGNHHELVRRRGHYFDLYRNQFTAEKETELLITGNNTGSPRLGVRYWGTAPRAPRGQGDKEEHSNGSPWRSWRLFGHGDWERGRPRPLFSAVACVFATRLDLLIVEDYEHE